MSDTKVCSHNWRAYYKREKGELFLNFMKCTHCGRVLDAEYLVRILGYVLYEENLRKLDEMLANE